MSVRILARPELRAQIEAEIDRLITMLDALDGDCDCESEPIEDDAEAEDSAQPLTLNRAHPAFIVVERMA